MKVRGSREAATISCWSPLQCEDDDKDRECIQGVDQEKRSTLQLMMGMMIMKTIMMVRESMEVARISCWSPLQCDKVK